MNIGAVLFGFGLVVLVVAYVARPLFDRQPIEEQDQKGSAVSRAELTKRRDALYALIRELDADFGTGKTDEEDYHAQRERLVAEGVAILKQLDALSRDDVQAGLEAEIEDRVLTLRRTKAPDEQPSARFCTQCGHLADREDRYCAQCGASLKETAVP